MATVVLPRSLALIIPTLPQRATVAGTTVAEIIAALERGWPGAQDRLVEPGPETSRPSRELDQTRPGPPWEAV